MFRGGLRGKVFTYVMYDPGSVQLLDTAHGPVLQPVLRRHALCDLRRGWAGVGGHQHAGVPVGDLPLEEVAVPVTHPEAASFLWGPVVLVAVRQVTGPAVQVETPQCATLHSSRSAVARTPSPGAYGQKTRASITQRFHAAIPTKMGQCAHFPT